MRGLVLFVAVLVAAGVAHLTSAGSTGADGKRTLSAKRADQSKTTSRTPKNELLKGPLRYEGEMKPTMPEVPETAHDKQELVAWLVFRYEPVKARRATRVFALVRPKVTPTDARGLLAVQTLLLRKYSTGDATCTPDQDKVWAWSYPDPGRIDSPGGLVSYRGALLLTPSTGLRTDLIRLFDRNFKWDYE